MLSSNKSARMGCCICDDSNGGLPQRAGDGGLIGAVNEARGERDPSILEPPLSDAWFGSLARCRDVSSKELSESSSESFWWSAAAEAEISCSRFCTAEELAAADTTRASDALCSGGATLGGGPSCWPATAAALATCFLLRPWSWFFKRPIISLVYYSTLRYVRLR